MTSSDEHQQSGGVYIYTVNLWTFVELIFVPTLEQTLTVYSCCCFAICCLSSIFVGNCGTVIFTSCFEVLWWLWPVTCPHNLSFTWSSFHANCGQSSWRRTPTLSYCIMSWCCVEIICGDVNGLVIHNVYLCKVLISLSTMIIPCKRKQKRTKDCFILPWLWLIYRFTNAQNWRDLDQSPPPPPVFTRRGRKVCMLCVCMWWGGGEGSVAWLYCSRTHPCGSAPCTLWLLFFFTQFPHL